MNQPNTPKQAPWKIWVAGGALVLIGITALSLASSAITTLSAPTQQAAVEQSIPSQPQQTTAAPTLSNDNHYTNVSGNTVHSPAYTSDNSAPAGASAQCGDGTYSFSQHRSGTCSHHGGVASWL